MLVLWTRFTCFARYIHLFCGLVISEFSWKSVYKWCWFVKTMQKCQNGGWFKMSKWCRYVKTLQVYFVKMVCRFEYFGLHHNLHHTTHASLMIEHSKRLIKQSKAWLLATSDPNLYLRDGISLVNSLRLLCPMHSNVLLLHTVCLVSSTILIQILSITSD